MANRSICGLLLFLLSGNAIAESVAIEVFVDSAIFPVSGVVRGNPITIYDFKTIRDMEREITTGLPANANAAAERIRSRLASPTGKVAYLGYAKAAAYGITKIPAMVFDGKAVIYGVNDIVTGLRIYQTWRKNP
jgi:integrating conjugative element protein (TIGR03757 family)